MSGRRFTRAVLLTLGIALVFVVLVAAWGTWRLYASVPRLSGELRLAGLRQDVEIVRDESGVAQIIGKNDEDISFALGFVHAQERFFQMDLLRRGAAGELAELLGEKLLARDRRVRVHRFRARAASVLAGMEPWERALIEAYVAGVNAGLADLSAPPPEYLLLGAPRPWRAQDTILVIYAMYLRLQGALFANEQSRGVLFDTVPGLAAFLEAIEQPGDAPLDGTRSPPLTIPSVAPLVGDVPVPRVLPPAGASTYPGSNGWAVSGARTASGRALVANDMHLGIGVPNIWYRAELHRQGEGARWVAGITLPGTPVVIAGSNGRVAWGFTNSGIDTADLVIVEPLAADASRYRTPEGSASFVQYRELIRVRGGVTLERIVRETRWGPLIGTDHRGRPLALRWVAHDPRAVNIGLDRLARARDVSQAIVAAQRTGMPNQAVVIGDAQGNIGWTLSGPIPVREGCDGQIPRNWVAQGCRWTGWLSAAARPAIVNPENGVIWSANGRPVGGEALKKIGRGRYAPGARGAQIRDALLSLRAATEADMLRIQLDDRGRWLAPWRDIALAVLDPAAVTEDRGRGEGRDRIERWNGRASTDSQGYRLLREFRDQVRASVFGNIAVRMGPLASAVPLLGRRDTRYEEAALALVRQRPAHLRPPGFSSWRRYLLARMDAALVATRRTPRWGDVNRFTISHPFAAVLPAINWLYSMGESAFSGDAMMPKVLHVGGTGLHGATERFAVTPGREARGYLHMPVGQAGHPLAPYYGAGHEDWLYGRARAFLIGAPRYTLALRARAPGPRP